MENYVDIRKFKFIKSIRQLIIYRLFEYFC